MAPKAAIEDASLAGLLRPGLSRRGLRAALTVATILTLLLSAAADARTASRAPTQPQLNRHIPNHPRVPAVEFPRRDHARLPPPLAIAQSQYEPVRFAEIPGWADDDLLQAFGTFRASCAPIVAQRQGAKSSNDAKALGSSLREPCRVARTATLSSNAEARAFFEQHFVPLRIAKLGDAEGFVTGYYEPIVEGSLYQSADYTVPVYRRPANLFVRGTSQSSAGLPNKGQVFRKIGRRKLVPYYDRAEIEDGAIAGRGLDIVWLKSETDLLFAQIQGSVRVKLLEGRVMRLNYDAHNGYPYTPVGRVLIDRGIVSREDMSMQRIRQYMEENPGAAAELRRQNRSYVFFREVKLSDKDEAVGAQGVPLTPWRSIAVDRTLHVYGTPFFIEGPLPIDSDRSQTPFRRLMIAQDTGSAIIGPARADIYFGAGAEAGRIAGRLKNSIRFVMLVPRALDPTVGVARVPVPESRPSTTIAKLHPQTLPAAAKAAEKTAEPKAADTRTADTSPEKSGDKPAVPLPQARPVEAPPQDAGPVTTSPAAQKKKQP